MKIGFGLRRRYRLLIAHVNLLRFNLRKHIIGFNCANLFLQRIDHISVQLILKNHGAKIGENCDIETGITFHNCSNYSNLSIGNDCHIGKNCFFDLRDKIIIKDNVVISMQSTFITHIDMTKSKLSNIFPPKQKLIVINNDVYIGAKSTILMGVEIEKCCFIAAGSIVVKKINKNTLVGGIPAKIIRSF